VGSRSIQSSDPSRRRLSEAHDGTGACSTGHSSSPITLRRSLGLLASNSTLSRAMLSLPSKLCPLNFVRARGLPKASVQLGRSGSKIEVFTRQRGTRYSEPFPIKCLILRHLMEIFNLAANCCQIDAARTVASYDRVHYVVCEIRFLEIKHGYPHN